MTIKIERGRKKPKRRKKHQNIGFSNKLALYTLLFLAAGLVGGFYLALKSIQYQYTGALVCWTVVFTPIGTAVGLIPHFVVHKSMVENSGLTARELSLPLRRRQDLSRKIPGLRTAPKYDNGRR